MFCTEGSVPWNNVMTEEGELQPTNLSPNLPASSIYLLPVYTTRYIVGSGQRSWKLMNEIGPAPANMKSYSSPVYLYC